MDEPRPRRELRISLRTVMFAVVVVAMNVALYKGLLTQLGRVAPILISFLLPLYNVLAFFMVLASLEIVRTHRCRDLNSWLRIAGAILMIGTFAGISIIYAVLTIFGFLK